MTLLVEDTVHGSRTRIPEPSSVYATPTREREPLDHEERSEMILRLDRVGIALPPPSDPDPEGAAAAGLLEGLLGWVRS